jgi:hypothetical protein
VTSAGVNGPFGGEGFMPPVVRVPPYVPPTRSLTASQVWQAQYWLTNGNIDHADSVVLLTRGRHALDSVNPLWRDGTVTPPALTPAPADDWWVV